MDPEELDALVAPVEPELAVVPDEVDAAVELALPEVEAEWLPLVPDEIPPVTAPLAEEWEPELPEAFAEPELPLAEEP